MLQSTLLVTKSRSSPNSISKLIRISSMHSGARRPATRGRLFLREPSNILWNSVAPLTEVASLYEYVPSSSLHLANTDDLPLHQYFHCNLRPVPTTVETIELGGAVELCETGVERFKAVISEGYGVSTVLDDLYAVSMEEEKAAVVTRRPEEKQKSGLIEACVAEQAIQLSMIVQPSISWKVTGVKVNDLDTAVEPQNVTVYAVENQDMNALRAFLATNPWPTAAALGRRVTEVLKFVIDHSSSSLEAFQMLENFTKANPKYYANDELLLRLCTRNLRQDGVKETIKLLEKAKSLPFVYRKSCIRAQGYNDFLKAAYDKEHLDGAIGAFKALAQLNMIDARHAVRSLILTVINIDGTVDDSVASWKRISRAVGTTEGVDILWNKILQGIDGYQHISKILRHASSMEQSSTTLLELICALARRGFVSEAHMIFSKMFLKGKCFRRPLERLVAASEIESIELIAQLVTQCMFGEKKQKGAPAEIPVQVSQLFKVLQEEVNKQVGRAEKTPWKYKRKGKKLKRHRVNEEQLYEVGRSVANAWWKAAATEESKKKLRSWCEQNGVMAPSTSLQR